MFMSSSLVKELRESQQKTVFKTKTTKNIAHQRIEAAVRGAISIIWCHITQAVQTTKSRYRRRFTVNACAPALGNENVFFFECCVRPSCHEIKCKWLTGTGEGRWEGGPYAEGYKSNAGENPSPSRFLCVHYYLRHAAWMMCSSTYWP